MNLNPRQFFHGTRSEISDGKLLPQSVTGTPTIHSAIYNTSGEEWRRENVFMTGDEEEAWHYAHRAPGDGRPRVYEVTPGENFQDRRSVDSGGRPTHHAIAASASIVGQIDIPAPNLNDRINRRGVQGQLPLDKDWAAVNPRHGPTAVAADRAKGQADHEDKVRQFQAAQARRQWPRLF